MSLIARSVILLSLFSSSVSAAFCFEEAAREYSLPVDLLKAIAMQESSMNQYAISKQNSNGSYDLGLMQINSSWLPTLAEYGITQRLLIDDPCLNVKVGSWVLASNFHTHGPNWNSVGAYNAGFRREYEGLRQNYVALIQSHLSKLQHSGEDRPFIVPVNASTNRTVSVDIVQSDSSGAVPESGFGVVQWISEEEEESSSP